MILDGDGPVRASFGPPPSLHDAARVVALEIGPERMTFGVESPYPDAHLVVNSTRLPGWQARVDGALAALRTANFRFMAVPVAPGTHRVTLEYRAPLLLPGAAVSAVAAIVLLLMLRDTPRAWRR